MEVEIVGAPYDNTKFKTETKRKHSIFILYLHVIYIAWTGQCMETVFTKSTRDFQNALTQCYFHSPRKMPPLPSPQKNIWNDSQTIHFCTDIRLAICCWVFLFWSILETRLRITDQFFCFILVFILVLFLSSDVLDLVGSSCYYCWFSVSCNSK